MERRMTFEIHLLSFSTDQHHPLAQQPIIFIITKSWPSQCPDRDRWGLLRPPYHVSMGTERERGHVLSGALEEGCSEDTAHPILYYVSSFSLPNGERMHISASSRKTLS